MVSEPKPAMVADRKATLDKKPKLEESYEYDDEYDEEYASEEEKKQ